MPQYSCFHPTMVGFKAEVEGFRRLTIFVSIPLWCDLKARRHQCPDAVPIRFHPTMVRFKAGSAKSRAGTLSRFHPTMVRFKVGLRNVTTNTDVVSIPLWCDLKHDMIRAGQLKALVSIPLWCDLKEVIDLKTGAVIGFPSHYGAI